MTTEFSNKLKSISIEELENTIGKAVSELIGEEYYCVISKLSYEKHIFGVSFEASIDKPLDLFKQKNGDQQ